MKKMVGQKQGGLQLLLLALLFAFSEPSTHAQREFSGTPADNAQNWAESPPGTFLEQSVPARQPSLTQQEPAALGQSEWQVPADSSAPQPKTDSNQLDQSPRMGSGNGSAIGSTPSADEQPSAPEPSNSLAPGPLAGNEPVGRPPLLGEVLKQEQTKAPSMETNAADQNSSLNSAAADALNTPVGSMAAGALSSLGLGQGSGQMSPQQIQQMIPGVLNFLMNVMPNAGNATNGPPGQTNYGGFPRFASPSVLPRNPQPQASPGLSRAINNAIRRGRLPGMNQMHF